MNEKHVILVLQNQGLKHNYVWRIMQKTEAIWLFVVLDIVCFCRPTVLLKTFEFIFLQNNFLGVFRSFWYVDVKNKF
jgi:hypothetical protein